MQLTELTVLLACHSLEDFPTYHEGSDADELLAAWCAPWHPALVAVAGRVPGFHRVDSPPELLTGRLMTVPPFMADRLPAGFAAHVAQAGGHLVRERTCDAAVRAALTAVPTTAIDEALADDFIALAFCRLQIELLTRQMRYSTNIDDTHFEGQVVAAARSAVAGDSDQARSHLMAAFDTLYEARKHFYPVDAYLIDVTLLATTTLGPRLAAELAGPTPVNLMAPVSVVEAMSRQNDVWPALLSAIDAGRACLVGDEIDESELPLVPLEDALRSLTCGARRYEELLGRLPQVFARRRAGLWPGMPQILVKLGYQGALHFTLDDGRFPLGPQSKTRWEGLDSSVVDVFARVPCDALRAESFLGFSRRMADAMDGDHVATLAFAHWPGATSSWYRTLRRIAELSPVLGKFMLLDDYFQHTDMPGRLSKFEPDEYRTPYLVQDVATGRANPLSTLARQHNERARRSACDAVATMADLVGGVDATARHIDDQQPAHKDCAVRLAAGLPRASGDPLAHAVVVNPLSFTRRIGIELAGWSQLPQPGGAVVAAGMSGGRQFAVVEVPGMGFATIQPTASAKQSRAATIGNDNVLSNEYFEIAISRATGGIQSLRSFNQRGNLLSQQLAFRLPDPHDGGWTSAAGEGHYSAMRAENVELTVSCAAMGEITSRGMLVDGEGQTLAHFQQKVQVWAGSRIVRLEIALDNVKEPRADAWGSYYAARFAWPDEAAELYRGVGLTRHKTEAAHFEAPEFLEIETAHGSVAILTAGLAHHRRAGSRMLDSLLVVRGETARAWSLGIAVEPVQAAGAACELMTPPVVAHANEPLPASPSGWFFHLDAKNVLATYWQSLVDGNEDAAPGGPQPLGFRARFLEVGGRAGRAALRTFRPVERARQVDFLGQTMLELRVEGDKIMLDFAAHEWIEVEVTWKA